MSIRVARPSDEFLVSLMVQVMERKGQRKYLRAYRESSFTTCCLPMAFACARGFNPSAGAGVRTLWHFKGDYRTDEQRVAFDETLARLSRMRTCILSVPCGTGKTFLALKLAAHIGLPTLVVIPTSKKVLQDQWLEEIALFLPEAHVQRLGSKSQTMPDVNIFLVGSHTIPKIADQLRRIPVVVVDELHLVLSSEGYKSLLYLEPQYLLGLSATPYRMDGSNDLVELFFGNIQITKALFREYTVHVLQTSYEYELERTETNELNWGSVLNQQAENEPRNQMIANIICENKQEKFLVLCKRVVQIKDVAQKCREGRVAVQAVYGDIAPVKDQRSLVGTIQKLGVGFSDSTFTSLIIGSDCVDYHIQYLGRLLRQPEARPTIYDIVDRCSMMRKHFKTREGIYRETGATICYKIVY